MSTRSQRRANVARSPRLREPHDETSEEVSNPMETKLLLTPQEAADALRISRSTLYKLFQRGEIPSLTIGRRRYCSPKVIEAWIARQLAE